jgi:tRNA(Ile)-lysidine synthase
VPLNALSAEEFAALMAPFGPFGQAPALAAGVSGGPHSLALALLADQWARARGGDLLALVADHGLRSDSAAEAAHVVALLAARGIAARTLRLGLAPGPAMQERARAARLAALLSACREAGRPWLLLGQHRLDQAETLLFRAARGSGPIGLAAMTPGRAASEALLLRPLLGVPPARLEMVPAAAGLEPVRDPSNRDLRFARIRLRQALADPDGTGEGTAALAEAATAFALRRARSEAALASRLAACARLHEEGFVELDPVALGEDVIADFALGRLVRLVGGARHGPAQAAVQALRRRGQGTLAGAWLRRGRRWRLLREATSCGPAVPARRGALWDGRFRLIGPGAPGHVLAMLGRPPAEVRQAGRHLPASVLPTLPAVFHDGLLVAVPSLLYPDAEACAPFGLVFAPLAGAATGQELLAGKALATDRDAGHSTIRPATLS